MPSSPRVLVVGDGPLAIAAAEALAAARLGSIVFAADRETDGQIPEGVEVSATRFEPGRSFDLLLDVDLVVDASGRLATRYLANDAAAIRGIPLVWAAADRDGGEVGVACDEWGADYRDLVPETTAPTTSATVPSASTAAMAAISARVVTEVEGLLDGSAPHRGHLAAYGPLAELLGESEYHRDPGIRRPGSLEERTAMTEENPGRSVTPEDLAAELALPDAPVLLDVREPWEAELAGIEGSRLIPLAELRQRIGELDPATPLVVYCHHGVRSGRALELLEQAGFRGVRHLTGGVDAWAVKVDPSLPRY